MLEGASLFQPTKILSTPHQVGRNKRSTILQPVQVAALKDFIVPFASELITMQPMKYVNKDMNELHRSTKSSGI